MFLKSFSKRAALITFMVLFGILSVSGNVFADMFTAVGQVNDANGNFLPGTGNEDRLTTTGGSLFGVVQCILAGENGVIDPPYDDGNPTGDDTYLPSP